MGGGGGSLVKLIGRDRLVFLPYIKETLENSNIVMSQVDGALIFAKDYRNDNLGKFFVSVARDENGKWIIRSNAPKSLNGLNNKIKEGGEVLHSDLPELPIIAKPELTAKALNGEANQADLTTKLQTNQEIIKHAKENGLSVKETKQLIQENEARLKESEANNTINKELESREQAQNSQREPQQQNLKEAQANKLIQEELKNGNEWYKFIDLRNKRSPKDYLFLNSQSFIDFKKASEQGEEALYKIYVKWKNKTDKYDSLAQLNEKREMLENALNIKPIAEFGTNYAEFYHDGKGAIKKLLIESRDYKGRKESGHLSKEESKQGAYKGQVAGAFYRAELGDIDLVWGDSSKGLQHILERRTEDFIKQGMSNEKAEVEVMELVGQIPHILDNGKIYKESADKNRDYYR